MSDAVMIALTMTVHTRNQRAADEVLILVLVVLVALLARLWCCCSRRCRFRFAVLALGALVVWLFGLGTRIMNGMESIHRAPFTVHVNYKIKIQAFL